MPEEINTANEHSEEITEIITSPPSWILRRGIMVVFAVIISIIGLASIVQYPDIIKTTVKINSLNSPKSIISKQAGKIVKILKPEGSMVEKGAPLAFLESTANHEDVLNLEKSLLDMKNALRNGKGNVIDMIFSHSLNIGELQGNFQIFYQAAQEYQSTLDGGNSVTQLKFMQQDLIAINKLKQQLQEQRRLQEKEAENADDEYEAYSRLAEKGVISRLEYKQQQNKYYNSRTPLQQTDIALLNNNTSYQLKQKEISDHSNTMLRQRNQFVQSLNVMITEIDAWIQKYVVRAPVSGAINIAGILQENQYIFANQELFIVNPGNTNFFGEAKIPQYNMGKIRQGQRALVKLKSFPFEEYGMIRGRVGYLADVAYRDSIFIAKINFERYEDKDPRYKIRLKNGMIADAEIITEESTLLQRFLKNIRKMLHRG